MYLLLIVLFSALYFVSVNAFVTMFILRAALL